MRTPPGPVGPRFIGNVDAYEQDRLGFLTRCAREYGDIFRFSDQLYIVSGPDLIHQILTGTHREFSVPTNLLRQSLGEDQIRQWLPKRRAAGKGLHRSAVRAHATSIVTITEGRLDNWPAGQRLAVLGEMEQITSRVIADYCFGADGAAVPALAANLLDALFPIVSTSIVLPAWLPTPAQLRMRRSLARLDREVLRIVARRRRGERADAGDLLAILMRGDPAAEALTDQGLCQVLVSVLLASHGVPAAALAWIWLLLAQHPESERKVHEEIGRVLGDRVPVADDLPHLRFVEAVVKEALRLYPPTWLAARNVAIPCELGGYPLPRGLRLMYSSYVVHRDPRFYPEPDAFVPERWLDDQWLQGLPKCAYFPFGGGPRVCLGSALAMTEIVLVTATIAGRFRLKLADGVRVTPNCRRTLLPDNLVMAIERR